MKLSEFFIICLTVFLFAGCGSRGKTAENPADIIELLKEYSGKEEILTLYTDETVKEFRKFIDLSGLGEGNSYSILSFIPDKSEVEVTGNSCDGDTCTLTVVFLKHPVENVKGFSLNIIIRKDGDSWKIDRSQDFREMSKGIKDNEAGKYLENL